MEYDTQSVLDNCSLLDNSLVVCFCHFPALFSHSYPLLLLLKALDRKLLFITQPLSCLTFQTVLGRCNALHALPTMLLHSGPEL